MITDDIRNNFLKYFENNSHKIIESSSLLPKNDPTLLFPNAGMNQFKDVFLGYEKRDYKRATTCQKCIRAGGKHNDLENVGHTNRHLTFFEMLGNFSFGDYFKKESIDFAWDVSINVFGFEEEKLWVSVFKEDDEAFEYWKKYLPEKKIVKLGKKDNFWMMGETGPCGPCSELYYDKGENFARCNNPQEDVGGERFIEFWNLVFMQFSKDIQGQLNALPKKNIDTGTGLERIVALKMQVQDIFQTDILRGIIAKIENIINKKYDPDNRKQASCFNVIADHLRSLAFAISDGIQPSNIERGYVIRKILRRAVRYGKLLGFNSPFLAKIFPALESLMGHHYVGLIKNRDLIIKTVTKEEEAFFKTLQKGGDLLNKIIKKSDSNISGDDAFRLKDTYGLPIDEILLIAQDEGLKVDVDKFTHLEKEAQNKSKTARIKNQKTMSCLDVSETFFHDFVKKYPNIKFVGYDCLKTKSHIFGIIVGNIFQQKIEKGQKGIILLDSTTFYAEKGGQIGDKGILSLKEHGIFEVEDCQEFMPGIVLHIGKMLDGTLNLGDKIDCEVNEKARHSISANHTATHILGWALDLILSQKISQAGSYVEKDRLRFDFNYDEKLTIDQIKDIEKLVNNKIRDNISINTEEKEYEKIKLDDSVIKMFNDKYGEKVRVVNINFSKELCGGTHVKRTGDIGFFKIVYETSIAAGKRRIEAVTGINAENFVYEKQSIITNIMTQLNVQEANIIKKINNILEEKKQLTISINQLMQDRLKNLFNRINESIEKIKTFYFFAEKLHNIDKKSIKELIGLVLKKYKSIIIILIVEEKERDYFFIRVTEDVVKEKKELSADNILKKLTQLVKAQGGGNKISAQGVISKKNKNLIEQIRKFIKEQC